MFTLLTYLVSKSLTMESFEALDVEAKAGHLNEMNEANAAAFKELKDNVQTTKEQIFKANEKLQAVQTEQIKQLNNALKAQGIAIKKFTDAEKSENSALSFGESITKALEGNLESLKTMREGSKSEAKGAAFQMEVKAAGAMTFAANVSGGNVPVEDRLDGFNVVASRRVTLLDIIGKRGTTSNVISWVYQANKDGAAGPTAEGATKNNIDFDIVVATENVKKITAFIKVSTEMLEDITWIRSEIQGELMRELEKAIETQVYNGDGQGQNLNGIRTLVPAFSGAGFTGANGVENPNEVDVLAIAINQCLMAEQPLPDYVLMSPVDVTKLKLQKVSSTDKRYIDRLLIVGSTLYVDGVIVIPSTLVTIGEYLIGYFPYSLLVTRTGLRFDIGLDGDDFTKNMRTILGEWRGLHLIKNNDRTAFVKGVFATDKTAILKS